jgi:AbiJ N-terminal domain 4
MKKLFTERHGDIKPQTTEALDDTTRAALLNLFDARLSEEWFGFSFPDKCGDGYVYAGTDTERLRQTIRGYGLFWPREDYSAIKPPSDGQIFELIEFSYEFIAEAKNPRLHSYMSHSHFDYDQDAGRDKFAHDVNRIFERNGMAFKLEHGEIIRTAPAILHESLAQAVFRTGDDQLDKLLEVSRDKFLNRSLDTRRDSLEKLWDAWERLKTIESGKDKKASMKMLLDMAASEPTLRRRLDDEAIALTEIGNTFMIRHTETNKIPVVLSEHVDYLFHRMFALVRLLLRTSGRGT